MTELQVQLNNLYEKSNYPSKEEVVSIVKNYDTTVKKVTNWFKQKRRRQFLKGKLNKQNYQKNWFSNDQVGFLKKWFANNMHPSNAQYCELARNLKTTQKHIKNWFSHQRQKFAKQKKQEVPIENNPDTTSQLTEENLNALRQMLQSIPLPERLQLALGNNSSQNIMQNLAPYYMSNQYMIMLYLQNQQSLHMIQNILAKMGLNEQNQQQNQILLQDSKGNPQIVQNEQF